MLASESRVPRTGVYMLCPSWRQKDARMVTLTNLVPPGGQPLKKSSEKTTNGDKQTTKSVIIY